MREIILQDNTLADLMFFARNILKLLKKIIELMDAIDSAPFTGIGKSEPLKGNLKGYWSRRIDDEHRLIYKVTDESITIISCRSHYNQ